MQCHERRKKRLKIFFGINDVFIRIRPPVWWSIRGSKNISNRQKREEKKWARLKNFFVIESRRAVMDTLQLSQAFVAKRDFHYHVGGGDGVQHTRWPQPSSRWRYKHKNSGDSPRRFRALKLHREQHRRHQLDWVLASTWSSRVMCWVFQCHLLIGREQIRQKVSEKCAAKVNYKARKSVIGQFSKWSSC